MKSLKYTECLQKVIKWIAFIVHIQRQTQKRIRLKDCLRSKIAGSVFSSSKCILEKKDFSFLFYVILYFLYAMKKKENPSKTISNPIPKLNFIESTSYNLISLEMYFRESIWSFIFKSIQLLQYIWINLENSLTKKKTGESNCVKCE